MRKVEVDAPRRVGPWTLIPVAVTIVHASQTDRWCQVYASKTPYAVILLGSGGARSALDTEGRTISMAALVAEIPALEAILNDVRGGRGVSHP